MRWCLPLLVAAGPALACEAPVCIVPNDSLSLSHVITFDTLPTSMGIGRDLSGIVTDMVSEIESLIIAFTVSP